MRPQSKRRWIPVVVAAIGATVWVGAIGGFLVTVLTNNLTAGPKDIRQYYVAVGQFYVQGFTVGFFLCFFLILFAVGILGFLDRRPEREDQPIPVGPVGLVKSSK